MLKFKFRCQMQNAFTNLTFYLILFNHLTNEPNSLFKRSILISMFNAFNYQLIIYLFISARHFHFSLNYVERNYSHGRK